MPAGKIHAAEVRHTNTTKSRHFVFMHRVNRHDVSVLKLRQGLRLGPWYPRNPEHDFLIGKVSLPGRTSRPAATCLHGIREKHRARSIAQRAGSSFARMSFPAERTYI
jgi:hypothetical protein